MNLRLLHQSSHQEWLVVAGLLLLFALFTGAVAGGLPTADAGAMQVQPLTGVDGSASTISADGQALVIPDGNRNVAARLRFT
jgi:hypothetical protein